MAKTSVAPLDPLGKLLECTHPLAGEWPSASAYTFGRERTLEQPTNRRG
jgi:hypothetical protein